MVPFGVEAMEVPISPGLSPHNEATHGSLPDSRVTLWTGLAGSHGPALG
jgi:hypothetical protein